MGLRGHVSIACLSWCNVLGRHVDITGRGVRLGGTVNGHSAAVRDAGDGADHVAAFQERYDAFRGSSTASGIVATAAIDRGWSVEHVTGPVQDAWRAMPGSSDASAILAVTMLDTKQGADDIRDAYRDVRGGSFDSAIAVDSGLRHGLDGDAIDARVKEMQQLPRLGNVGAAILAAASIETGRSALDFARDLQDVDDVSSSVARSILVAAAATAGVPASEAATRFDQMHRHLPSPALDRSAIIVAADLLREHRPGIDAPTYLYALETPDDD